MNAFQHWHYSIIQVIQVIDALANRSVISREIYVLVGLLVLVTIPHANNVSVWVIGFFLCAAMLRVLAANKPRLIPGKWLLFIMVIIGIGNVIMHADLTDARRAGTALLVVMLGLKLIELKDRRDIYVCVFLSYFVVMTQFLYQQNLWLAIYLFILTGLLTSTLINLNRVHFDAVKILKSSSYLGIAAIPMTVALFVFFPRLDSPLWAISIDKTRAVTGISDHMRLGSIGELSRSSKTAFRVKFLNRTPAPRSRYWRGTVLWLTDGVNWETSHETTPAKKIIPFTDSRVDYEITLEPSNQPWIYALDLADTIPNDSHFTDDYQLVSQQPLLKRTSYTLSAHTRYKAQDFTNNQKHLGLQLPSHISERVRQLVLSWLKQYGTDNPLKIINAALHHFNQKPFIYTLSPGLLKDDPIDEFLFDSRRGFCEHYAASFTLLMRLAGIPSRIVLGYQGGEKNPHADHWLIRQSDAHAWVEVWLDKQGWVRIDPTAAVAPERIEQSIDVSRSDNSDKIIFKLDNNSLLAELWQESRWLADAVELGWHRWVLGFSSQRQSSLFNDLGLNDFNGIQKSLTTIALIAISMMLGYIFSLIRRRPNQDPNLELWHRLQSKLVKNGLDIPSHMGPKDTLALASKLWPEKKNNLEDIIQHYIQLRYGTADSNKQRKYLRMKINKLRLKH